MQRCIVNFQELGPSQSRTGESHARPAAAHGSGRRLANHPNFNVRLYSQQAGLTLHDTLSIAGVYARVFSSNADAGDSYGLAYDTRRYIEYGYDAGRRGLFGRSK
jgi:hypothetical protein